MNRGITYFIFFTALLLFAKPAQAQLLDSLALDSTHTYFNLESALKEPEKVIKLSLRKMKLKTFPAEIIKFTNLQYLDLGKNKIKELPADIGKLKNLQWLNIGHNKLEILPPEIGELKHLKYLNANQNDLVILPPQIGDLLDLEHLDLWSNNLSNLPESIKNLVHLKTLDLQAILLNINQQKDIRTMLPKTSIKFSPPCHCGL